MKYDWSKELLELAIKKSHNYSEVLRELGIPLQGNNISTLKRKIKLYGINTEHFTGRQYTSGNNCKHYQSAEKYLGTERRIQTWKLKLKLFREGLKEHRCECCGINEWMGKPISLQLHHIDGNNKNNTIENLQILCPNCHSQTENYCGLSNKIEKEKKHCPVCGVEILPNSNFCPNCASKNRRKLTLTKEEIVERLEKMGWNKSRLAKELGVSDTVIRKRLKS